MNPSPGGSYTLMNGSAQGSDNYSEDELLEIIFDELDSAETGLLAGPGDDACAWIPEEGRVSLLTTDISIEEKHFRHDMDPFHIGFRSMSANLSDIAAMGGTPRIAVVSLGLTDFVKKDYLIRLYHGMLESMKGTGCLIAGGDLSSSDSLILSIALYGDTDRPILRSGAGPGQWLYCTGSLGGARAGLELLDDPKAMERWPELVRFHLMPQHRAGITDEIRRIFSPTAMIDISDGLSLDIHRLCRASGCGCILDEEAIPLSPGLAAFAGKRAPEYALSSGEEYELIFSSEVDPGPEYIEDVPVHRIGRVTKEGIQIHKNDTVSDLPATGFDHFLKG